MVEIVEDSQMNVSQEYTTQTTSKYQKRLLAEALADIHERTSFVDTPIVSHDSYIANPPINLTADDFEFDMPAITPLALVMRDAAGGALVRPRTLGELLCWIHAGCTLVQP